MQTKKLARTFLIKKRLELGLSLQDMSSIIGITKQNLWGIESGRWSVTLDLFDKIESIFGPIDRTSVNGASEAQKNP